MEWHAGRDIEKDGKDVTPTRRDTYTTGIPPYNTTWNLVVGLVAPFLLGIQLPAFYGTNP